MRFHQNLTKHYDNIVMREGQYQPPRRSENATWYNPLAVWRVSHFSLLSIDTENTVLILSTVFFVALISVETRPSHVV